MYPYRLVRDKVIASPHGLEHVAFILYRLNPVTAIVLTFQRAIYGQARHRSVDGGTRIAVLPDHAGQWWYLWQLLLVMVFSVCLFVLALKVFGRLEGNFAEEL